MKKTVLLLATLLLTSHFATAQVLYSEDFDNLTLGDVGTDFTGTTPGQGGWYTLSDSSETPSENSNSYFKIVSEPGRGKVLELAATPGKGQTYLQKRGIDALWSNRTAGNDILKIEIDFYTGDQFSDGGTGLPIQGAILAIKPNDIFNATSNDVVGSFGYRPDIEYFTLFTASKNCYIVPPPPTYYILKLKTWIKIIYYLDVQNQKINFVIPSNNFFCECFLDSNTTIQSFLLKNSNWIGSQATIPKYRYDNLIISAVDTVPLSVQDFISDKFNLYPNPAKNIINITNNENIGVEQVTIFDIDGKLIKTKTFNKEHNVQLDFSAFAAGTYLVHIETNKGTAIKKLIKK